MTYDVYKSQEATGQDYNDVTMGQLTNYSNSIQNTTYAAT